MTDRNEASTEEQAMDLLDTLLEAALRQENQQELSALPAEETLSEGLSFSPEFEGKLKGLRRRARRHTLARRLPVWSRRVAVLLLSLFTITGLCLLTAPEVRAGVASIFMRWFDDHAEFHFAQSDFCEEVRWVPTYLPEDFTVQETDGNEDDYFVTEFYKNAAQRRLMISTMPAKGSGMAMDNEHSVHRVIQVNEVEGHLFEGFPGYPTMLVWTKEGVVFTIIYDINDTQEVLKIAEGILPVPR